MRSHPSRRSSIAARSGRVTFGERLVSAALGIVLGGIVGLALAWLFGVNSRTLGTGQGPDGTVKLVASTSLVFGMLGLALGSHAASWLGDFIGALFALEGANDREWSSSQVPGWVVAIVLVAIVFGVFVWLR